MFMYKTKAVTNKKNTDRVPNGKRECTLAVKVVQVSEWAVYSILQLLEEWAAFFAEKSKDARKTIPYPYDVVDDDDSENSVTYAFKAEVDKLKGEVATDEFVASFLAKCKPALPKSHQAFYQTLIEVWEGTHDASIRADLTEHGTTLTGRFGGKAKSMPSVESLFVVSFPCFFFFLFLVPPVLHV